MGVCLGKCLGPCVWKKGSDALTSTVQNLFELSAEDIDGDERELSSLCKGKQCIMVVNVATK